MTDLRLEIARAIGSSIRLPNHMDRADEVLRAIEAAGYAVVPTKLSFEMDSAGVRAMERRVEGDRVPSEMDEIARHMFMGEVLACNSAVFRAAWAAALAAAPPLVKET